MERVKGKKDYFMVKKTKQTPYPCIVWLFTASSLFLMDQTGQKSQDKPRKPLHFWPFVEWKTWSRGDKWQRFLRFFFLLRCCLFRLDFFLFLSLLQFFLFWFLKKSKSKFFQTAWFTVKDSSFCMTFFFFVAKVKSAINICF